MGLSLMHAKSCCGALNSTILRTYESPERPNETSHHYRGDTCAHGLRQLIRRRQNRTGYLHHFNICVPRQRGHSRSKTNCLSRSWRRMHTTRRLGSLLPEREDLIPNLDGGHGKHGVELSMPALRRSGVSAAASAEFARSNYRKSPTMNIKKCWTGASRTLGAFAGVLGSNPSFQPTAFGGG